MGESCNGAPRCSPLHGTMVTRGSYVGAQVPTMLPGMMSVPNMRLKRSLNRESASSGFLSGVYRSGPIRTSVPKSRALVNRVRPMSFLGTAGSGSESEGFGPRIAGSLAGAVDNHVAVDSDSESEQRRRIELALKEPTPELSVNHLYPLTNRPSEEFRHHSSPVGPARGSAVVSHDEGHQQTMMEQHNGNDQVHQQQMQPWPQRTLYPLDERDHVNRTQLAARRKAEGAAFSQGRENSSILRVHQGAPPQRKGDATFYSRVVHATSAGSRFRVPTGSLSSSGSDDEENESTKRKQRRVDSDDEDDDDDDFGLDNENTTLVDESRSEGQEDVSMSDAVQPAGVTASRQGAALHVTWGDQQGAAPPVVHHDPRWKKPGDEEEEEEDSDEQETEKRKLKTKEIEKLDSVKPMDVHAVIQEVRNLVRRDEANGVVPAPTKARRSVDELLKSFAVMGAGNFNKDLVSEATDAMSGAKDVATAAFKASNRAIQSMLSAAEVSAPPEVVENPTVPEKKHHEKSNRSSSEASGKVTKEAASTSETTSGSSADESALQVESTRADGHEHREEHSAEGESSVGLNQGTSDSSVPSSVTPEEPSTSRVASKAVGHSEPKELSGVSMVSIAVGSDEPFRKYDSEGYVTSPNGTRVGGSVVDQNSPSVPARSRQADVSTGAVEMGTNTLRLVVAESADSSFVGDSRGTPEAPAQRTVSVDSSVSTIPPMGSGGHAQRGGVVRRHVESPPIHDSDEDDDRQPSVSSSVERRKRHDTGDRPRFKPRSTRRHRSKTPVRVSPEGPCDAHSVVVLDEVSRSGTKSPRDDAKPQTMGTVLSQLKRDDALQLVHAEKMLVELRFARERLGQNVVSIQKAVGARSVALNQVLGCVSAALSKSLDYVSRHELSMCQNANGMVSKAASYERSLATALQKIVNDVGDLPEAYTLAEKCATMRGNIDAMDTAVRRTLRHPSVGGRVLDESDSNEAADVVAVDEKSLFVVALAHIARSAKGILCQDVMLTMFREVAARFVSFGSSHVGQDASKPTGTWSQDTADANEDARRRIMIGRLRAGLGPSWAGIDADNVVWNILMGVLQVDQPKERAEGRARESGKHAGEAQKSRAMRKSSSTPIGCWRSVGVQCHLAQGREAVDTGVQTDASIAVKEVDDKDSPTHASLVALQQRHIEMLQKYADLEKELWSAKNKVEEQEQVQKRLEHEQVTLKNLLNDAAVQHGVLKRERDDANKRAQHAEAVSQQDRSNDASRNMCWKAAFVAISKVCGEIDNMMSYESKALSVVGLEQGREDIWATLEVPADDQGASANMDAQGHAGPAQSSGASCASHLSAAFMAGWDSEAIVCSECGLVEHICSCEGGCRDGTDGSHDSLHRIMAVVGSVDNTLHTLHEGVTVPGALRADGEETGADNCAPTWTTLAYDMMTSINALGMPTKRLTTPEQSDDEHLAGETGQGTDDLLVVRTTIQELWTSSNYGQALRCLARAPARLAEAVARLRVALSRRARAIQGAMVAERKRMVVEYERVKNEAVAQAVRDVSISMKKALDTTKESATVCQEELRTLLQGEKRQHERKVTEMEAAHEEALATLRDQHTKRVDELEEMIRGREEMAAQSLAATREVLQGEMKVAVAELRRTIRREQAQVRVMEEERQQQTERLVALQTQADAQRSMLEMYQSGMTEPSAIIEVGHTPARNAQAEAESAMWSQRREVVDANRADGAIPEVGTPSPLRSSMHVDPLRTSDVALTITASAPTESVVDRVGDEAVEEDGALTMSAVGGTYAAEDDEKAALVSALTHAVEDVSCTSAHLASSRDKTVGASFSSINGNSISGIPVGSDSIVGGESSANAHVSVGPGQEGEMKVEILVSSGPVGAKHDDGTNQGAADASHSSGDDVHISMESHRSWSAGVAARSRRRSLSRGEKKDASEAKAQAATSEPLRERTRSSTSAKVAFKASLARASPDAVPGTVSASPSDLVKWLDKGSSGEAIDDTTCRTQSLSPFVSGARTKVATAKDEQEDGGATVRAVVKPSLAQAFAV